MWTTFLCHCNSSRIAIEFPGHYIIQACIEEKKSNLEISRICQRKAPLRQAATCVISFKNHNWVWSSEMKASGDKRYNPARKITTQCLLDWQCTYIFCLLCLNVTVHICTEFAILHDVNECLWKEKVSWCLVAAKVFPDFVFISTHSSHTLTSCLTWAEKKASLNWNDRSMHLKEIKDEVKISFLSLVAWCHILKKQYRYFIRSHVSHGCPP